MDGALSLRADVVDASAAGSPGDEAGVDPLVAATDVAGEASEGVSMDEGVTKLIGGTAAAEAAS